MDIYASGQEYDRLGQEYASDEEIDFYLRRVAGRDRSVLELGCGTGRLTIPIAERGFEIVGIDIAPAMLETAREKATRRDIFSASFVSADVRDFDLGRTFDLIFFPINSLAHLHSLEEITACFDSVRHHLSEEGRFVIDIFTPSFAILSRDASVRFPVAAYTDTFGESVVVEESSHYDAARQVNYLTWHYQRGRRGDLKAETWTRSFAMRQFFPQEIDALLTLCRFTVESKFGDFFDTPFSSDSIRQLIVCQARPL